MLAVLDQSVFDDTPDRIDLGTAYPTIR